MLKSTVPFQRDDDFISRDTLGAVRRMCTRPTARAALVGLGGVGKSQIAIEYAYQVLNESPDTWVFWVHAETQERINEGYLEIAKKTKMDGWNDPKANVMQLVSTWLRNEANGRWVMVIDSADDASVFLHDTPASRAVSITASTTMEPLFSSFLPQPSTGSVLITSRSHEVAYKLTGAETNIVEVGPMNDQEAFALLQKKFTFAVQRDEADALISALDHMPLALTQAAAFINRTPRMSISRYLKEIDHNRARLLDKALIDIRRDVQASNSIMTTWQISFDYIRERSSTAARLLSLMCLFDRQGIPKSILQGKYAEHEHGSLDFEHDMYMLTSFCLVKASADESSFEMHGLVQFSMKKWLELNNELEYWKEIYVALIDKSFPVGRPENWSICQTLFPHTQAALDNHPFDADALEAWASISLKAAGYMGEMGEYSKAYKHALDSLDVREILLWPEDPDIFDSLNSVGVALSRLGRYEEAKTMYQRAVEAKERVLGADHLDTLTSMLNLASLYNDQGHWTGAEKLLQQVLEVVRKTESEAGRCLTLSTLTTLATTHSKLGRSVKAAELGLQVLKARETELGTDHPTTLTVKCNLASTYSHQGRFNEAEELYLQVLKVRGLNLHAETEILVTKAHLASIYKAQGRWTEAENLQLEVMSTSKTKLGPVHPDTFYAMGNLAGIYWTQGRFSEAEALQLQLLDLRKATLGEEHPSTLDTKCSLAATYWSLERYEESEALTLEVLKIRTAKLGDEHPLTVDNKANLASTYRDQGRFKDAQQLEEVVLKLRKETLGEAHPSTLGSMGNLAVTYHRQGWVEKAFKLMENCYEGHVRVLGEGHPITVRYREGLEKWRREDGQGTR
ncbi:TPR-like protein [Macroventuria anomochaeta]|uniref:TPR-like protein n=1 Tax=Macroventuria anomochaeta TaxID=301207 RepID=A0ACB6SG77_9PLEO|nr:TPR-like protein [Macroventuria anomochaeta]KAF2632274.1 TPR-like protein [Macroventuria anomochaeta]